MGGKTKESRCRHNQTKTMTIKEMIESLLEAAAESPNGLNTNVCFPENMGSVAIVDLVPRTNETIVVLH